MRNKKIYLISLSAMLMVLSLLIPMYSPIKIMIEPASFTLGSHVAIMIAMFISPFVAISVEIGATIGFLLGGFPLTVVLRAGAQIVFVLLGALYLKKHPDTMQHKSSILLFALITGIIHGVSEVLVVMPFYVGSDPSILLYNVFVLVGIGTWIHSCIDLTLALLIWKSLVKTPAITQISSIKKVLE